MSISHLEGRLEANYNHLLVTLLDINSFGKFSIKTGEWGVLLSKDVDESDTGIFCAEFG